MGRFGALVGEVIAPRAEVTDKHGPVLRRYDRWGQEVDEVVHHPTWTQNKADLVRNGFVSLETLAGRPGARRGHGVGVLPRVPGRDGHLLRSRHDLGRGRHRRALRARLRRATTSCGRLRSLDPDEAWEGGMFLTERQGGSDVGANTTRAVQDGDEWLLFGEKHFCSNVDAEVFIVLARPEGAPAGSRGLATYIVPRILPDGSPNGFTHQAAQAQARDRRRAHRRGVARRRPGVAGRRVRRARRRRGIRSTPTRRATGGASTA